MEQKLIKPIVKVGNGAGVLLPKKWLNGKAKIELVEKPLDINSDVLRLLSNYLNDILGIYIVGSYARGEQTKDSDVDVLAITSGSNKKIKNGKYEIILISKEEVEKQLEKNAIPLLPMLKEARVLINENLIEEYKKVKLTDKNLKWHIETTKSAMKMIEKLNEASKEIGEESSEGVTYSLILRLRTLYTIDCIKKNKQATREGLLKLIKKITGGLDAYEIYVNIKNEEDTKKTLPLEKSEKLREYILNEVKKL